MLLVCIKIFFARIVDVSLGTIRTVLFVKGKIIEPFVVAFFEVIIWFIIAKEALNLAGNTFIVAIFYAAGYATGTLIGAYLSRILVKGKVVVQAVIDASNNDLVKEIRSLGYKISIIKLKRDKCYKNKVMIIMEINSKDIKLINNIIHKYQTDPFITINDTKYISNIIFK